MKDLYVACMIHIKIAVIDIDIIIKYHNNPTIITVDVAIMRLKSVSNLANNIQYNSENIIIAIINTLNLNSIL